MMRLEGSSVSSINRADIFVTSCHYTFYFHHEVISLEGGEHHKTLFPCFHSTVKTLLAQKMFKYVCIIACIFNRVDVCLAKLIKKGRVCTTMYTLTLFWTGPIDSTCLNFLPVSAQPVRPVPS